MKYYKILFTVVLLALSATSAHAVFTDVKSSDWFSAYVEELAYLKIVSGNPDGSFRPNQEMTRAEITKVAVEIAKRSGTISSDDTSKALTFEDVSVNSWYAPYVALSSSNAIIEGYKHPDGSNTDFFKPEQKVSRAEALKILLTASGIGSKQEPRETFIDVVDDSWYAPFVTTAFNWGIVDGYRNKTGKLTGQFGPSDPVTRAQAAKIGVLVLDPYALNQ